MTVSVFASLVNVVNLRAHQVVTETKDDERLKRAAPGPTSRRSSYGTLSGLSTPASTWAYKAHRS